MTDTSPEVAAVYRGMLMSRSGAERFLMGLDQFAMAGRMMLAGLRSESTLRLRERAFLRLYASEFSPAERDRIVRRIRAHGQES